MIDFSWGFFYNDIICFDVDLGGRSDCDNLEIINWGIGKYRWGRGGII